MTDIKHLVRTLELVWADWRLSRIGGIPFRTVHKMTEQEVIDFFVGEDDGPPEEDEYICKFDV
jgi:hypothetical protein